MKIILTLTKGDEKFEYTFPAKFEVCNNCDGHGSVFITLTDPSSLLNAQCPTCQGKRVVPAIDETKLSNDDREFLAEFRKQERIVVADRRRGEEEPWWVRCVKR